MSGSPVLAISPQLSLPLDAATETFGILAVKRSGKSNAAVVLAEEMFDAGIPWVAVDPKGDWWGLRSSGDGKGPGLPIVVFGGEHGDVPLEPTSGRLVADLVAEKHLTCVLDVSIMTKADMRRFLTDFALRLFQVNREPLHVFCEEADEYIPQRFTGEAAKMVGAFEQLVKRGGFRGIGVTLITQRSASLNKDVTTQVGTLIALRTTGPQDRKAILDWVKYHAIGEDAVTTLSGLANGEAWVFSPEWLNTLERIKFRRRRTFDSGATPKVGEKRRQPVTLADVDLASIKEQMAESIERAKESDPKELRARIKRLERDLAAARTERPEVQTVEVPTVPTEIVEFLEAETTWRTDVSAAERSLDEAMNRRPVQPSMGRYHGGAEVLSGIPRVRANPPDREPSPLRDAPRRLGAAEMAGATLPGPQRKLLTVLAVYGQRTRRQLALQAGYSMGGGGFNNPLGALRSAGYVDPPKGEPISITNAGLAALGEFEPLPSGPDLLDFWLGSLPGPAKKILRAAVKSGPQGLSRVDLAERAGYSPVGGGFNNPLGRLRTLELVTRGDPVRLTDDFMEAIQ